MEAEIEVLRDKDDHRRIEMQTDGKVTRIGRDIEANLYVGGQYEEWRDLISEIRYSDHPTYVNPSIPVEGEGCARVGKKYLVEGDRPFRFFDGFKHVLTVSDHELGVFYTAMKRAEEKRDTYDYLELAESWLDAKAPKGWGVDSVEEASNGVKVVCLSDLRFIRYPSVEEFRGEDAVIERSFSTRVAEGDDNTFAHSFRLSAEELRDGINS